MPRISASVWPVSALASDPIWLSTLRRMLISSPWLLRTTPKVPVAIAVCTEP